MSDKKVRFTVIDVLIVLAILAVVLYGALIYVPSKTAKDSEALNAVYTVLLTEKEDGFVNGIHIGDTVSISNKEKDTAVITKIETKPAETMQYNGIKGEYVIQQLDNKKDVYVTLKSKAISTDTLIKSGGTPIKVGTQLPVRGKGYASSGYIIIVDTVE